MHIMEPLIVKAKEFTPGIRLGEGDTFLIEGRSIPENPDEYYRPVITWMREFLEKEPGRPFVMEFRLEYMNSGSTKYILELLRIIKKHLEEKNTPITLRWYFEEEDESIQETGEHFRDYLGLSMEVIPVFS